MIPRVYDCSHHKFLLSYQNANYFSISVQAEKMSINSLVMWKIERLIAPENADVDYASTCKWIFGHMKGTIKEKTMIIKIGHLFEDDVKPAPKLGHQVFITSSTFLISIGLNRE